jgi:hypothetical protein
MDDGDYPVTFMAAAVPAGDALQHRWDDDQRLLDDLGGAIRQAAPADQTRVLVFTAPLELEVMDDRAVGQIVPPGPGEIWVQTTDLATFGAEADSTGFLILPDRLLGPVRLRCDTKAGRLFTAWVRL